MALYFVDYDLRGKRDYQKLYDELAKYRAVHVLESLWCLRHASTSCKALRDHLTKFIDGNDAICVSRVTDWASIRTINRPLSSAPIAKPTLAQLAQKAPKKPPK